MDLTPESVVGVLERVRSRIQLAKCVHIRGLPGRLTDDQVNLTTFAAATAIVRGRIESDWRRDAVTLYFLEGMGTADIAERMGLSEVSVEQLVQLGVREMVRNLGRRES